MEGRAALHVDSGVDTTSLPLFKSELRIIVAGSSRMENTPLPSVVALETTAPPYWSCTWASAWDGRRRS